MTFPRILAAIGCFSAFFLRVGGAERNFWPVKVEQVDAADRIVSWEGAGPLLFGKPAADVPGWTGGLRPLYVQTKDPAGMITEASVVYPIFVYRADADRYRWSVFNLINRDGRKHGYTVYHGDATEAFDVWPFYFSLQTGAPESSYRALFPIAGTIKNRLGFDRLDWVLWPIYFRTEKQNAVTTSVPWPFLRFTHGAENGFAVWPLYGHRVRPERWDRTFFLWPLGWNNKIQPPEDSPAGTAATHQQGFIPFYTRDDAPGYVNVNYAWPFFGYTDRTAPYRYHETRYFWPFFVQGRGDQHYVNRWGPFYTHSIHKGTDKQWYMWPLLKRTQWQDAGIAQTKTQFLFALYFSIEQRSVDRPLAPPANRTHLWPLFSHWDNGAGRRQFQLFSPFDVFFPRNQEVRDIWTPLFAIYRSDVRSADSREWSALWHAVTWKQEGRKTEFHLGPLLNIRKTTEGRQVSIGSGLIGWKRRPDGGGRLFVFDFLSRQPKLRAATR